MSGLPVGIRHVGLGLDEGRAAMRSGADLHLPIKLLDPRALGRPRLLRKGAATERGSLIITLQVGYELVVGGEWRVAWGCQFFGDSRVLYETGRLARTGSI